MEINGSERKEIRKAVGEHRGWAGKK